MNFYIADNHFGHTNIIKHDNRPFKNATIMDEVMIDKWNKAVSVNDIVYILGDFSWHDETGTIEILDRLVGNKILVIGNHDVISDQIASRFVKVCDYLENKDGKEQVVMSHYPMFFWNGQFDDTIHLYGHVHNSQQWSICERWKQELRQLQNIPMRMYNVGCMMDWMDFTPRTLQEVIQLKEMFQINTYKGAEILEKVIIDGEEWIVVEPLSEEKRKLREKQKELRKKKALACGVEPFSVDEAIKYYYPDEWSSDIEDIKERLASYEDDYYSSGFMTLKEWGEEREKYDVYKDSTGHD